MYFPQLQSLSVDELTAASKQIVSFTDISGVTRVGKALTNGNLLIKDLFTSQCYIYFVSYAFNNAIKWSYFFIVPQSREFKIFLYLKILSVHRFVNQTYSVEVIKIFIISDKESVIHMGEKIVSFNGSFVVNLYLFFK